MKEKICTDKESFVSITIGDSIMICTKPFQILWTKKYLHPNEGIELNDIKYKSFYIVI
jgi:hypothetical protein